MAWAVALRFVEVRPVDGASEDGADSHHAHTHDTTANLATCPACRVEEARADLERAQARLRHLLGESADDPGPVEE